MIFPKHVFETHLRLGAFIYFINRHFIRYNQEPHFHICLHKTDGRVIFVACCTSTPESSLRHFEKNGTPMSCLPCIRPDSSINELSSDTYVNCGNGIYEFTIDELYDMYCDGNLRFRGMLLDHEIEQVRTGISESPLLEEGKKEIILTSFPK